AAFTVNSSTQITATSPTHVSGTFDVQVTTAGGTTAATRTDLFTFTNWTDMAPATLPGARTDAAFAYDAARNQTVLFGGSPVTFAAPGETWIWDGTNWKQVFPATSPTSRLGAAMAYDPVSKKVVLVGGDYCGDNCTSNDVWAWDGTNWTSITTPKPPPLRHDAALAHTAAALVLFGGSAGGYQNDTWVSTDGGQNWSQMQAIDALCRMAAPCPNQPALGVRPALADAPAGTVLLFEGDSFSASPQTWVWNGSGWSAGAAGPPNRAIAGLAYDRLRGQVVLFGGYQQGLICTLPCPIGPLSDTWLWDGSAWTQDSPVTSPPPATAPPPPALPVPRTFPLLAGDPRGGVVLYDGGPNDTWGYV
ncbi:MAG TPA: hypothetical protein VK131_10995, partial [Candidatus Acidoferrales bacterium]|nr:hypothetical protein [Candidatus Acidoferrales bacterium]